MFLLNSWRVRGPCAVLEAWGKCAGGSLWCRQYLCDTLISEEGEEIGELLDDLLW